MKHKPTFVCHTRPVMGLSDVDTRVLEGGAYTARLREARGVGGVRRTDMIAGDFRDMKKQVVGGRGDKGGNRDSPWY